MRNSGRSLLAFGLRLAVGVALCVSVANAQTATGETVGPLEGLKRLFGQTQRPAPVVEPARGAPATAPAEARNLVPTVSGNRVALVIGNDNYQRVGKLRKAGADATTMAGELSAAGFKVQLHHDLTYRGLVKAIETLSNSIVGGDQVVVFYSGHGVQLKTGNYLLPVDIDPSSDSEVEKTAYALDDVMEKIREAKASFALVIIDACRNNPFAGRTKSIGATRGLSPVEPPKGQMVVYSASKNQEALDSLNEGDPSPNGVFTREFIKSMRRPGVRIQDLMVEVQDAVEELARTVSHEQRPALYNEARGNFWFYGPTNVTIQHPLQADPETETWATAQRANTVAAYQTYLDAFPRGRYVPAANIALKAPVKPTAEAKKPVVPSQAPTAATEDPETAFWNEVKASGAKEYLDAYIKQYPKGKYVSLAKIELKKLDDKGKARRAKEEAGRKAEIARFEAEQQAAAEREKQDALRTELNTWERAKSTNALVAYQSYLDAYPSGRYAGIAQTSIQRLQRENAEREGSQATARERKLQEAEELVWEIAQRSNTESAYIQYQSLYSRGKYAGLVTGRLEAIRKSSIRSAPTEPQEHKLTVSIKSNTLPCWAADKSVCRSWLYSINVNGKPVKQGVLSYRDAAREEWTGNIREGNVTVEYATDDSEDPKLSKSFQLSSDKTIIINAERSVMWGTPNYSLSVQ